ncbi:MAG: hypothetical protein ACREHD_29955, partial [Pirellulales bacterium]
MLAAVDGRTYADFGEFIEEICHVVVKKYALELPSARRLGGLFYVAVHHSCGRSDAAGQGTAETGAVVQ